jgi:hypothetical protein
MPMSEVTRYAPLHYYRATALTCLPVVTAVCWKCQHTVTLADEDTYDVSRVDGNGANGYEPCHLACPQSPRMRLALRAFTISERLEILAYDRAYTRGRTDARCRIMVRVSRILDRAYSHLSGEDRWYA